MFCCALALRTSQIANLFGIVPNNAGLFWKIQHLDLHENAILYAIITLLTTYLVILSYRNCKFYFKHQIAQKREEAVRREINANNKLTRKEKDDQILAKKNEVADYEATNYSVFYNNLIFFAVVVLLSCLVFKRLSPSLNYALSSLLSSGLIALLSTGSSSQKKA